MAQRKTAAPKEPRKYQITDAARGSFTEEHGRVAFDLPAGVVSEGDVDAEVLARLVAAGIAVDPDSVTAESAATEAGSAEAPAAESEEPK